MMPRALMSGGLHATLALLVVVAGFAPAVCAQENPYNTAVDTLMGGRTFRAQCGRCHGRDATGNDETGAPDLTVPLEANTDQALFDVIRNGVDGTAMIGISSRASDLMVWQIVSYLNSFSIDPADYDLPGDIGRGESVYNAGACASCHRAHGEGGRLGPDLTDVGTRLEPREIRTSLTDPDDTVLPRWWTMRVTRPDGSVVEGLRMDEDTFTLRILDDDENLWHFSKSAIRASETVKTSSMPVADDLTANELDDLVAYLFSLRGLAHRRPLP